MKDKNNHKLEVGNKVWIVDMDEYLWEIVSIDEKANIKNLTTDAVIDIDGDKLLKHAE